MFRMFKYLYIANLYKKTKRNVIAVGLSLLFLLMTVFVSNDLIVATLGSEKYLLILFKWLVIGLLLWIIIRHLKKIWSIPSSSLQVKACEPVVKDYRKERILGKERLQSRSDLILKKYKKES